MHPRNALASPRIVVGGLIGLQLVVVAALAASIPRNGWVFYQGGDQIYYATSAWLIGSLELPLALVSGGWPLLLAPGTWLAGPTFVQSLPYTLALNLLVLGPIGVIAVYSLCTRIAGRTTGYRSSALWVIPPLASIPLFVDRYHERWVDQFLPQAVGLTALADYPSMIITIAAAALVLRSLDLPTWQAAALAGLVAGYGVWTKPSNAIFLFGAVLAYLIARRWSSLIVFAAALAPAVVALAVWKYRGLGSLPVFGLGSLHLASDALAAVAPVDRYFDPDFDHWRAQMAQIREYFWSVRIAQWAPLAGLLALARLRPAAAGLLGGWLGGYLLVKGTSPLANVESGSFFRLLLPAWPAYLILVAAIPFLVPGAAARLRLPARAPQRIRPSLLTGVAALLAVLPVAVVLGARPVDGPGKAILQESPTAEVLTPVVPGIETTIEADGERRIIRWRTPDWRTDVFYRVFRTEGAGSDVSCTRFGTARCVLKMVELGTTRGTSFVDGSPPPGVTYRVAVATNSVNDPTAGDIFGFGPPAREAP